MSWKRGCAPKGIKQSGLVLVLVTASLLVLVVISAFAIDVNHHRLNATRVQNAVDSAALAAANIVNFGGTVTQGTAEANAILDAAAAASGNSELDFDNATVNVTYSNDPLTFPDGSFDTDLDVYARVSVSGHDLDAFFVDAFGLNKAVMASAVAGPSSSLDEVNIVPIGVCAGDELSGVYGYLTDTVYALKVGDTDLSEMGNGNYHLLDFASGASTIRDALAGNYTATAGVGDTIATKPGASTGPTAQGVNTRLGVYNGGVNSSEFPPDLITQQPATPATLDGDGNVVYTDTYNYDTYEDQVEACINGTGTSCESNGVAWRRVLMIPIMDCSGKSGGASSFTVVDIGCFFFLQQAPNNNSGAQTVYGEFVESCVANNGTMGEVPSADGVFRIVLYEDPLSEDS